MTLSIEHIGLWCQDLETMRAFYETYFKAKSSEKYYNPKSGFSSYFLTFTSGARLELCHRADIKKGDKDTFGLTHLAFSLGSKDAVDDFAYGVQAQGFPIINGPRTTGDGYYEAVILDPEGNQLELTI
ncbi:VOC family protein [Streptococcus jiangjianxini]|uniref:VOC family protein n=1 Tax=Streptococcus jiangjianxini TaxID=3161189 RepID=UPI0032EF15EB